jgi:hypothetical protein
MARMERYESMVPKEGGMTKAAQFRVTGEVDADLAKALAGLGFGPAIDGNAYLELWVSSPEALKTTVTALRPLVEAGKITR